MKLGTGILAIMGLTGMLLSCKTGKNTVAGNGKNAAALCRNIPFGKDEPLVGWNKALRPDMASMPGTTLPQTFESFAINDSSLRAYFRYAGASKAKTGFSVPLPGALGCQYFEMEDAGTMAPELAAKFPDIVSLKGLAVSNKGNTIRLDYDGRQMRAQINWDGIIYLVTPVVHNSNIIYLVYDKNASGDIKQPFEENPKIPATINNTPSLQKTAPMYDR